MPMELAAHSVDEKDSGAKIRVGKTAYLIQHDEYTGDWYVSSTEDDMVQGEWFRTRDYAVKYALECAGVIESPYYKRAPERC